jgi:hypothetical protein
LDTVLAHSAKRSASVAAARGRAEAIVSEVKEDRKLVQVARRIGGYVARNSNSASLTRNAIGKVLSRDKSWVGDGIDKALALGYIVEDHRPRAGAVAGKPVAFYRPGPVKP